MYRVYDVRIIVQSDDADDGEDADSITEQMADLIEVRRLELGDCVPMFVGVRATGTERAPREIKGLPKPRKVERPDHCRGCRYLSKARWCSVAHERRRLLSGSCSMWEAPSTFRIKRREVARVD